MGARGGRERTFFVDESKTNDYLLVAVGVARSDLEPCRRALRALVLRGQSRLHMRKESDPRRRRILTTVLELPISDVVIVRAPKDGRTDVERRAACIRRLVGIAADGPATLCFELDETLLRRDRQLLVESNRRLSPSSQVHHRHDSAAHEPLLAAPDAIAWAWAKGGDWRRRCGGGIAVEPA
ncbi:hypothetical protein HUN58_10935 [Curtobacterium sp. Csp1]|uniref:hypothetical protein n=1 Tax=unclassified Curtobacterium TaxID=257496 RepID=UPI001599301C|nr:MULTISPECIES: hypothetical protein [unclassified Curtobacterium]QKS13435.1 hypothetical protein HUN60_10025 [Curtobacterium sp. csp3]QKS20389.1 hypothetical protein HUN58_10935 [Curtobacterium sp. Csp1]